MTEEETQQIPAKEISETGNVSKESNDSDETKEEISKDSVKEEPVDQ